MANLSLTDDEKRLSRLCDILHTALGIGMELLRQDLTMLVSLQKSALPDFIASDQRQLLAQMKDELDKLGPNSLVYQQDPNYPLTVLVIRIVRNGYPDNYLRIGPYVTEVLTPSRIVELLHLNSLPLPSRQRVQQFLKTLPLLSDQALASTWLALTLLTQDFAITHLQPAMTVVQPTRISRKSELPSDASLAGDIIVRYDAEKRLRAAIAAGDKQKAHAISFEMAGNFGYRTPDNPLRTHRNLAYASNTIYRLAALDGGIDPAAAHRISESFSRQIENLNNYAEIDRQNSQMIDSYCEAVQTAASQQYSEPVSQAILYVNQHFASPLTLRSVAQAIRYSPSHLSHRFNEETGQSLGDWINEIRIRDGNRLAITDVALMVGYTSYSYFSTQFKKRTGRTCREYLQTT
jgi:two-component system response regulator YesN